MRILKIFVLLFLGVAFVSCNSNEQAGHLATKKEKGKESVDKSLEKANRYLIAAENKEIDDYVRRHNWDMNKTGTGLRYRIYKRGKGKKVEKGDIVKLKYQTYLIDGRLIYTSSVEGPKEFKAGHGDVERGLEEAVLLLHQGDKAKLILPAHLAFGLNGDGNRVPKRATVIYDVELIDVK